ncbi:AI-2E family transporter [Pontibacter liquoris]|uniref:AI-2E family transporter n=1 Tax=Pontibacter liquoris TaxID=2905677 RepID=UPI001FA75561|nr:AI-2E family transporter [Pontibacter liquoris]
MLSASSARSPDYLRLLLYVLVISLLMYLGQPLLVPLSFALLISFVLYPVCRWLERHHVPRFLAIGLALLALGVAAGGLLFLLANQFIQFSREWPSLQGKITALLAQVSRYLALHFNLPLTRQALWVEQMLLSGASQLLPVVQQLAYSSAVGFVLLILIPFYSALILYYREEFARSLVHFFPPAEAAKVHFILRQTITTFYNFIKGMALVYLIVALLNVVGLLLLGIPHAVLFGVVASLLTFIPYVGITLGSLLPITMAWLTYDSVWYPLGVVAVFTVVQYLEANVIFPMAVSYRLQVNTLFMILAIVAGGLIWGGAGMILFVPFLGILKLVADQVERWQPVGRLLGIGTRTYAARNQVPQH